MISDVTFENTVYQERGPLRSGNRKHCRRRRLGAALEYVSDMDWRESVPMSIPVTEYAMELMLSVSRLTLIGTAEQKTAFLSFVLKGHAMKR